MADQVSSLATKKRSPEHNRLPDSEWRPLSDWPLTAVGQLASVTDNPSFLLFVCQARPLWRQALFLALAMGMAQQPESFVERLSGAWNFDRGDALRVLLSDLPKYSPTEIIDASTGNAVLGLRGTLQRLGDKPLRPESYRRVLEWYRDGHDPRPSLLRRMGILNQDVIDVLGQVHPCLLPAVCSGVIRNCSDADRLNDALEFIKKRRPDADDNSLRQSAARLANEQTVESWVREWLRGVIELPNPIDECDNFWPAKTVSDLGDIGRRYRNCVGTHLAGPAISGKVAIVECRLENAIIVLSRLAQGLWLIAGIHGPGNKPVDEQVRARVERLLLQSNNKSFASLNLIRRNDKS